MVAVITPGPAINGMASGKAAILRRRSSTACSACCDWRPVRTPNTISEDEADRVDHDKQSDERGDQKVERHACRSRYLFAAILARQKGTRWEP
jgi:hypothetical protein